MDQITNILAVGQLGEQRQIPKAKESTTDFSKILADTLQNSMVEKSISMSSPSGKDAMGSSVTAGGDSLEYLIMTATASGEADDAQIALFMLCLMMQNNENSEMGMLMEAMGPMLSAVKGGQEPVRQSVMASDFHPYILQTIDKELFHTKDAVLPSEAWKASSPAITANAYERNPEKLRQVIDQFQVDTAQRYTPYRRGNDTYCNIFVWDVTRALGCEIPHYINPDTGAPRTYPDVKGATELGANATHDWLITHGPRYGWKEVTAQEAQAHANQGRPAVTAWKNPTGASGHVQVVCPSKDGGYDPIRGVSVAQAGRKNYNYTHLSSTFSQSQRSQVRYFVHA